MNSSRFQSPLTPWDRVLLYPTKLSIQQNVLNLKYFREWKSLLDTIYLLLSIFEEKQGPTHGGYR